jgi:predicted nucleic acid-binding protein
VTRLVLDSGALSAWASRDRRVVAALEAVRRSGGHVVVPTVVIAESTTGDRRRDAMVNRRLKGAVLDECDEPRARRAAALRFLSRSTGSVSVVDAIVAAAGEGVGGTVMTGDPDDLNRLASVSGSLNIVTLDQLG